jgi:acetylcholinesterase
MRTDVEPLFKRVIMESGGPTSRAVYPSNHKQHEQQWQEFLHLTGLFDTPDDQKLEKLRSLPVSSIVQASETIYHRYEGSLRWPWQPVIDGPGGMLPEAPIDAWKNRRYHKVNILTGFNTNEGTTFVNPYVESPADFTNFFRTLIPKFQEEDIDMLNQVYPDPAKDSTSIYKETRKGLGKQYKRLAAAYGDFAYIAPVRQTAYYASATGASDDADVYLYHFAVNSSVAHGASHGSNDPYVVNSPSARNIDELQKGIAIHMHAFWTSFVISGNPNDVRKGPAANRMVWGQYGKRGSSAKIVFGEGSEEIAHKGPLVGSVERMKADLWEAEESKFWWARVGLVES